MVKKSKTTKYIRGIDTIIKFQQDDGIESLTISGKESLADLSIDKHGHTTLYLNADKDKIDELNSLVPFIDVKTSLNVDIKTVELSQNLKKFALELTTDSQQLAEIIKETDNITLDLSKLITLLNEHSERIEKAQRQAEIATEKADKAQETADTATEKADKAQETADTATEKADKAQETADTALAEIAKTNELVKQVQTSADKAQETADNNKKEIEETQKEVDGLQQTSNELLEKIRKHNLEIEDTKTLLSLTNNRIAENENRLNETQENIEQLANEISEVNEQVEKNTLNIENISGEIKTQKERVDDLYTKHAELVAKNGEQDQDTLDALNKAEEAVLGLENLKKELENINNTNNELTVKIGELNGQTQQLNKTKDNILVLIGNLQNEKSKLENDLKTLEDLIKQVNDGLTITNQELGDKILKLNQLKEKQVELEKVLEELKNKKPVNNPDIVYIRIVEHDDQGYDIKTALENNDIFKANITNTVLSSIDKKSITEETKVIIRDNQMDFYLGLITNIGNNVDNFDIKPLVKLSGSEKHETDKSQAMEYILSLEKELYTIDKALEREPDNEEILREKEEKTEEYLALKNNLDNENNLHLTRLSNTIGMINNSIKSYELKPHEKLKGFYEFKTTDDINNINYVRVNSLTGVCKFVLDLEYIIMGIINNNLPSVFTLKPTTQDRLFIPANEYRTVMIRNIIDRDFYMDIATKDDGTVIITHNYNDYLTTYVDDNDIIQNLNIILLATFSKTSRTITVAGRYGEQLHDSYGMVYAE